jgi:hypothetical protein
MKRARAVAEIKRLLRSGAREAELQKHLERHPSLVAAEHAIWPFAVISKLPLGADFVTDFVYFWSNSTGTHAMLTEIEAPTLRVFTEDDQFTSDFNRALQQLRDWRRWCADNHETLDNTFEPLSDIDEFGGVVPSFRYVHTRLIAGRRKEVLADARRRSRWETLVNDVIGERYLRTWDGFAESLSGALELDNNWQSTGCFRYRAGGYVQLASAES